ncbi:hypothetical protein ANACOL_04339 [Anaerotruncus colihominis DSM 17241]|uniref:Uncharacterized protein n=1 Tax=Anaerotruncus colihominis DSM 17241 TaxID=445972 RepID=B0PHP5_9FIRM|nr:hypothetical protein ANACOL_04339 [Anaerotruncus colihominis DSM 17241]
MFHKQTLLIKIFQFLSLLTIALKTAVRQLNFGKVKKPLKYRHF